jgi:hypothetical protein
LKSLRHRKKKLAQNARHAQTQQKRMQANDLQNTQTQPKRMQSNNANQNLQNTWPQGFEHCWPDQHLAILTSNI